MITHVPSYSATPVPETLRAVLADQCRRVRLRHSTLSMAATVTVVTGSTAADVLRAFGADPAQPESLRRISDGVTARMSIDPFAEGGHVLASFEPPEDINAGPAVAAALDGLDFDDYRDEEGKGLAAVQRFTGSGITAQDLDRIEAADIAFRIVPRS